MRKRTLRSSYAGQDNVVQLARGILQAGANVRGLKKMVIFQNGLWRRPLSEHVQHI